MFNLSAFKVRLANIFCLVGETDGKRISIRQSAFTLVELLVVISIIALLLAILMPSLSKARKQAQSVVCKSNLKQWGMAWLMYAQGNNGAFFHGLEGKNLLNPPGPADAWEDEWYMRLYSYVKVQKIILCPSAKNAPLGTPNWSKGDAFIPWGPTGWKDVDSGKVIMDAFGSYGVNAWIHNPTVGVNPYGFQYANFWKRADVSGGNNIPIILDSMWNGSYPDDPKADTMQSPRQYEKWKDADQKQQYNYTTNMFCINRHNGTINGVFLDGSARSVGLKELWKLKWHRNYDTTKAYPKRWPTWMSAFK